MYVGVRQHTSTNVNVQPIKEGHQAAISDSTVRETWNPESLLKHRLWPPKKDFQLLGKNFEVFVSTVFASFPYEFTCTERGQGTASMVRAVTMARARARGRHLLGQSQGPGKTCSRPESGKGETCSRPEPGPGEDISLARARAGHDMSAARARAWYDMPSGRAIQNFARAPPYILPWTTSPGWAPRGRLRQAGA